MKVFSLRNFLELGTISVSSPVSIFHFLAAIRSEKSISRCGRKCHASSLRSRCWRDCRCSAPSLGFAHWHACCLSSHAVQYEPLVERLFLAAAVSPKHLRGSALADRRPHRSEVSAAVEVFAAAAADGVQLSRSWRQKAAVVREWQSSNARLVWQGALADGARPRPLPRSDCMWTKFRATLKFLTMQTERKEGGNGGTGGRGGR